MIGGNRFTLVLVSRKLATQAYWLDKLVAGSTNNTM